MWIVRLALRRPYTFVVTAMLILLLGGAMARRMPADIFPAINIPVVTVIRTYTGMSPQEMERRIVTITERAYTPAWALGEDRCRQRKGLMMSDERDILANNENEHRGQG